MTWFRVGGAGIPAALKNAMNAVFNKKFGTTGQNYPPNQWPDEVNLMGPLPEGTASGPIANISDGAVQVPLKSWNSNVDAIVDGVSEVSAVRSGKNLFPNTATSDTVSDVTFTVNNDGSVSLSGTASAEINFIIYSNFTFPKTGNYFISGCPSGGSTSTFRLFCTNYGSDTGNGLAVNVTNLSTKTTVRINIKSGVVTDGLVFKPQIEVGSTATTYEAYEAPTTYTVSLGRTIHGGSLELISGAGTDENGVNFTFDPISPIPETVNICNFWTDVGSSSIVYRRDIDLALQAVSSSRGLMMASRPVTQLVGEESDPDQVNELVEDDEDDIREQLNEVVENDETEQEGENDAR